MKKTDKTTLGDNGETLAREYLLAQGYRILETQWRHRRAEIDLIAMDGEVLVFVEVKTRKTDRFGAPAAFVSARKEELMSDGAIAYMEAIGHDQEIRFDIIGITWPLGGHPVLEHFKDAFFPGTEEGW